MTGWAGSSPCSTARVKASWSATQAPVMAAVRVPPSAWSTSQSTRTVPSPMASWSTTARSARPMRRWISLTRPPETAVRGTRSRLDPGSMAYSAVTQPRPPSRSHRGTSGSNEAVHSTRVRPISMSTDPGVISV